MNQVALKAVERVQQSAARLSPVLLAERAAILAFDPAKLREIGERKQTLVDELAAVHTELKRVLSEQTIDATLSRLMAAHRRSMDRLKKEIDRNDRLLRLTLEVAHTVRSRAAAPADCYDRSGTLSSPQAQLFDRSA